MGADQQCFFITVILSMHAQHWNRAMLRQFPGLADMEIEKTMLFGKDHDEVRFVISEIFKNAFLDPGLTDIVDFGLQFFKLVFPAAGLENGGFVP
jgi:hypothetical protein